jgi:hypothetical protein
MPQEPTSAQKPAPPVETVKRLKRTEMNAIGFQRKDAKTPSRKGLFALHCNPSESRISGMIFHHGFHGWKTRLFLSVPSVKSVVESLCLRLCVFAPLREK